jgi:hypothetical protein
MVIHDVPKDFPLKTDKNASWMTEGYQSYGKLEGVKLRKVVTSQPNISVNILPNYRVDSA